VGIHTKNYPNIWCKNESFQDIQKHQIGNKVEYGHGWTVSDSQLEKKNETAQQDIQAFQVLNIFLNYNCIQKFGDVIFSNHALTKSLRPFRCQHVADSIGSIFQVWFILVLLFFLSLV